MKVDLSEAICEKVDQAKKRCCECTEALRELTGKGQCTAKKGAHVHDEHVII